MFYELIFLQKKIYDYKENENIKMYEVFAAITVQEKIFYYMNFTENFKTFRPRSEGKKAICRL